MEKSKWPAISGLVFGTIYLCRDIPTTFAFDKPLLSAIIISTSLGCTFIALGPYLSRVRRRNSLRQDHGAQDDELPHTSKETWMHARDSRKRPILHDPRTFFLVLICALILRVQLFLRILGNVQCTISTWEPFVPLAFAWWDYRNAQRHAKQSTSNGSNGNTHNVRTARSLIAVALVSFGGVIAIASTRTPASTYICSTSLSLSWLTPVFQVLGSGIDVLILYCTAQLLQSHGKRGAGIAGLGFGSIAWALLYTALFSGAVFFVSAVVHFLILADPAERVRFFVIPTAYIWSVLKLDMVLCFTAICALVSISHVRLTTLTLLPTFTSICTVTISYAWENRLVYPPTDSGMGVFATFIVISGLTAYLHSEAAPGENVTSPPLLKKMPAWLHFLLLTLFFLRAGLWTTRSSLVPYHPVDTLTYEAQVRHDAYREQAFTSKTLAQAADAYRERYKRHPPPGFGYWYEYATSRNSVIIDDFDSIYHDLLPFYAISPKQIRYRTWQVTSNPWHNVLGLSIRKGKVEISPNDYITHRWMLDSIVRMITPFSEWLPDMDLAFNVDDEPSVAVPYEEIEELRQQARSSNTLDKFPDNSFSANRAEQWTPVLSNPTEDRLMTDLYRQPTFYEFGSVGCPPGSPARDQRLWDVQRLCASCVEPHSKGVFLANWSLAADICHQPDLANLHGLYISSVAFKATHELYPIFSQAKVHGFNDILLPSPWNYIDKSKYGPSDTHPDVAYRNKNHTMFWRGSTSEGISHDFGHHWKGMARQRFIRLSNNIKGPSTPQYVLFPADAARSSSGYRYVPISISELTDSFPTDVRVVEEIGRCNGIDCFQQEREFAPIVDPSDFQDQWRYKFLLDLDGVGFSGRFLPFLSSHSLPLKAALFREWWDDRVTAWQHFVPLDLRGHGFWATLAYFAGFEGKVGGKNVKLEPHEDQGERIAENGREWANKALRKEDMEIYLFRLLLEWGRLTDDRRDEIGFVSAPGL